MVRKLTKESEDKILSALTSVAELTSNGSEPNDAIVKVASDKQIPAGHIQLIVNAYNTGRSTAQRKSSDDVWDKSASFPIADTSVILDRMFPSKVKTASAIQHETTVSSEYDVAPYWMSRRKEATTPYRFDQLPKAEAYPTDPLTPQKKANIKLAHLQQDVEEARRRTQVAFDYATQLKHQVTEYFKTANHQPFNEVRYNSELKWGQPAFLLFKQLREENPEYIKQAATWSLPATGKIYDLLAECFDVSDMYQELRSDYYEKTAAAEAEVKLNKIPFEQPMDPILKVPVSTSANSVTDGSQSKKEAGFGSGLMSYMAGGAGIARTSIPSIASSIIGGARSMGQGRYGYDPADLKSKQKEVMATGPLEDKYWAKYNPTGMGAHNAKIDDLEQQSMLTDLLSGDEVISQHDPHQVLDSYMQLRSLAPQLSKQKELVRAYLRKKLETGQQDIFDLKTYTDVEKNLGQINSSQRDDEDS